MRKEAFDYGQYKELHDDPRTSKALGVIDSLAKKMSVKYSLIGGLAAYIHMKNPPDDFPDVDILLDCEVERAQRFINVLSKKPKFELGQYGYENDQAVFGMFRYDDWVQIDVFTDADDVQPEKTKRVKGVEIEPVEYLVIEKMIRAKRSDVRSSLDLLAYTDYDKTLLFKLARERHLTGAIGHLEYFARRLAAGRLSDKGIDSIVDRLTDS